MTQQLTKKEWLKSGSLLLAYLLFLEIIPRQRLFSLRHILPPTWRTTFGLNALLYALPILLMLLFYSQHIMQNFSYFRQQTGQRIKQLLLYYFTILLLNSVVARLVGQQAANQNAVNDATKGTPIWATFLLFVLLGPMLEETVFRQILLSNLSQLIPKWLAAIISGSAFVLIHVNAPQDIILYAPLGIVFTMAYLRQQENISFTYSLHLLNNIVALLVSTFLIH
ncbi:CPBP family intramembrane glutamic endopeptidase [Lapidilactobacillus gannanensis]|uniref:CPBP family intramembrane glutamic endopeptidase n=1 Tax=Lapidilactobacillus gannanensis TaxID=2486002 RepID=A0ABW4BML9_9LACO|nr:type II CAAX endopeptidase family protein [Lapidilactobacillus gannanensis]